MSLTFCTHVDDHAAISELVATLSNTWSEDNDISNSQLDIKLNSKLIK